jgi:hypothetical protein
MTLRRAHLSKRSQTALWPSASGLMEEVPEVLQRLVRALAPSRKRREVAGAKVDLTYPRGGHSQC